MELSVWTRIRTVGSDSGTELMVLLSQNQESKPNHLEPVLVQFGTGQPSSQFGFGSSVIGSSSVLFWYKPNHGQGYWYGYN